MKVRSLALLLCVCVAPCAFGENGFDLELSYGRWSLSPYTSLAERETENLIKRELTRVVDSFLPNDVFSSLESIDLSSSGQMVSFTLWYRFNRLALGLKTDYFEFLMPFSISAQQSISFLDFALVDVRTEGRGEVRLSSVMLSFLARWEVLASSKFQLYLQGGLNVLPYSGEIYFTQTTTVRTPLGDAEYSGDFSETIKNIRSWDEDIPSLLWAPVFGAKIRYVIHPRVGLFLDMAFAQGTVLSAGLSFLF
jgi:hypothetical protein